MAFEIGFVSPTYSGEKDSDTAPSLLSLPNTALRNSVVQVYFEGRELSLSYYNDRFDLHKGDLVYVEGKLEGQLGRVTDINYNFKIRLSDYKRIIAVVDTQVHGQFFIAGSHLVTFDREALPADKAACWFMPRVKEDDMFISGSDDTSFLLDDLSGMKIRPEIAQRGYEYFSENSVRYLSLDGGRGYAVVEGSRSYEVEFKYKGGEISNLVCSCFCCYNCKHEFAVMLQLKETLSLIEKHYAEKYEDCGYFAAIYKNTLFEYIMNGKETGMINL